MRAGSQCFAFVSGFILCVTGIALTAVSAEPVPFARTAALHLDSGPRANLRATAGPVYRDLVLVPEAKWLRVTFAQADLPAGSTVRMTSLLDLEVQELDAAGLEMWDYASAYFNGNAVLVELIAGPGTVGNRIVVDGVWLQSGAAAGDQGNCGICGTDDRVPTSNGWAGRLIGSSICSASIWNERSCLVSAGHCVDGVCTGLGYVVQFHVPDSLPDGTLVNPPCEDQFPIVGCMQEENGPGADWSVLTTGTNNLGETAFERYGELRRIAPVLAFPSDVVSTYGYGVDDIPDPVRNQTLQTSDGVVLDITGASYKHDIDTRSGNSGGALLDATDQIIGIHTNCVPGCNDTATRIDITKFAAAQQCPDCLIDVDFNFPSGIPDRIALNGTTTLRVVVSAVSGVAPVPHTGLLHMVIDGQVQSPIPMDDNVTDNDYVVTFPTVRPCGAIVEYYVTVETTVGAIVRSPATAPLGRYIGIAAATVTTVFGDDFESDTGWTMSGSATAGFWDRAVPIFCDREDPPADADGSGRCFLTGANVDMQSCNTDVDNGNVILTSPILDATNAKVVISYSRWLSNNMGDESLLVEVSADGGQSWVTLEAVGPNTPDCYGEWYERAFQVADFVSPSNLFSIRFIAADDGDPTIIEAAVDNVQLRVPGCFGLSQ